MKQLNLTFTLFNEETRGIGDALGMTDDQLAEDFAILAAAVTDAQNKGGGNSAKEIIDIMLTFDFFPQFLMYSGLAHFASALSACLVQEPLESNEEEK